MNPTGRDHLTVRPLKLIFATTAAASALAIGACGGDDETAPPSPAATTAPAETAARSDSADGGFCDQTKANGADGASFGELEAWAPKEELTSAIAAAQRVMRSVTPPDQIAAAWRTRKQHLAKVRAAADRLPPGGNLTEPIDGKLVEPGIIYDAAASKAVDRITRYWFDTCG